MPTPTGVSPREVCERKSRAREALVAKADGRQSGIHDAAREARAAARSIGSVTSVTQTEAADKVLSAIERLLSHKPTDSM